MLHDLLYRCRALFRRNAVESELDDELRFHTEQAIEKRVRGGMPREAAARQVRLEQGGLEQQKELCRDARGTRWLEETWLDLRYAVRRLRASPIFTTTALLTLALGAGVNLVTFSALNTVLFRKLPVTRPEELVVVTNQTHPPLPAFSYPDYLDFQNRNHVFSSLGGYRFYHMSLKLHGANQRLWGYVVTGNYFDLLGEKALLGRALEPDDDRLNTPNPVAVISYGCWQRRFGADPAIVGRQANISGHNYTIVGVTRPEFFGSEFFFSPEVWVPLSMLNRIDPAAAGWWQNRTATFLFLLGRLNPGATAEGAARAMRGIAGQLGQEYPELRGGMTLSVDPPGTFGGTIRSAAAKLAALLIAITGLVLLVACTNLASLLLARATTRRKEIAMRLTLGAARARLVRQLFAESALLSIAGGAAGALAANWTIGMVAAWRPPVDMQVRANLTVDARAWCFTIGLTVATALLFGLAPAFSAARTDVAAALKGDSAFSGTRRRWPFREMLISVQVAISLLLLAGAWMVTGSIQQSLHVNLGFDPAQTTTAAFELSPETSNDTGHEFERKLLASLRSQPGVDSTAIASNLPLDLKWIVGNIHFEGAGTIRNSDAPAAIFYQITPGYLQTVRTRLIAGRDLDERDRDGARRVALVNEEFARAIPRGGSAIGSRFRLSANSPWIEVVGVVETGKHVSLALGAVPAVYLPREQAYSPGATVIVRSKLPAREVVRQIRSTAESIDPGASFYDAGSLSDHLALQALPGRSAAGALSGFGLLALLLSATGIYGIVAYAVSLRTREIGIRMALGARAGDIVRLVAGRVAVLLAGGVLCGIAAAALLTPLLVRILFGSTAANPVSLVVAGAAMSAAAGAACWGPARRALAIEPAGALRRE